MKSFLDTVKFVLLLAALLAVGWSALPETAQAEFTTQVTCEGEGHSCHADINGTTYHLKKITQAY